jgi:acyl-coenzyme A thioesterase 9
MVVVTRGGGGAAEGMWTVLSALSAKWRAHSALLAGGTSGALLPTTRDLSALRKQPRDSFVRVLLPLASSPALRAAMLNARGHLRVGRLLEEMDAFSGVVAQLHCDDGDGARAAPLLVTAAFDRIDLLAGGGGKPLPASEDLELSGCVTYAGRSSLNIDLDVVAAGGRALLRASTTFVARDAAGAPVLVPQLAAPLTPLEAALRSSGRRATEARKAAAAASLLRAPPSPAELAAVHGLFVASQGTHGPWTEGTRLTSTSVTMPDQKNVYGRIFGGHLMRLGYEISWAAGWRATGNAPRFLGCSDVLFRAPVEVGTLLNLSAELAFAREGRFTVVVDFSVETPGVAAPASTNQMTFHFSTEDGSPAPRLFPKSYRASMRWVEASRHWEQADDAARGEDLAPRFPRDW